jgi:hypothetical protein
MGYTACFIRGSSRIDLDGTGRYSLALNFTPPLQTLDIYTAGGTSANLYAGAERIGEKAGNRDFAFGLRLLGSTPGASGQQLQAALDNLNRFLQDAGDENNPTYFCWRSDSDISVDPIWGQRTRRLEVVSGRAGWGQSFGIATLREIGLNNCPVVLQVKPFSLGQAQIAANVMGWVTEDTICAPDGMSRGFYAIAKSFGNLCINPSAETNTTGWTPAANAAITRVADSTAPSGQYVFRVVSTDNSTNRDVYCQVSGAAARAVSAWVKATAGDVIGLSAYNATDGTIGAATFTATGEWQRVYTYCTPSIAGATNFSIYRNAVKGEFLFDAFQIEATSSYTLPYRDGDMLGNVWSSTAHGSATTTTACMVTLPASLLSPREGAVKVVVKLDVASTFAADQYIFDTDGAANFKLYYTQADDKFNFTDGTNAISTAAQTWAQGDTIELIASWKAGSLKLYKNGVEAATGSTYTPYTGATLLYIGATEAQASPIIARFDDFQIYDAFLTAAQAAALYAHDLPIITDGKRCGYLPWAWSLAGAGAVANMDDATHKNYIVAGGIPGTVEADTKYQIASDVTGWTTRLWLCRQIDRGGWRNPATNFYLEGSGTAEAGNSNADYNERTHPLIGPTDATASPVRAWELAGNVMFFMRARSESATPSVTLAPQIYTNNGAYTKTEATFTLSTTYKLLFLGTLRLPEIAESQDTTYFVQLQSWWTAQSAAWRLDFSQWFVGSIATITPVDATGISGGLSAVYATALTLRGRVATYAMAGGATYLANRIGDPIDLQPGVYNTIRNIIADTNGTYDLTRTATYSTITITPRWAIA